jgi:hypothetical protein
MKAALLPAGSRFGGVRARHLVLAARLIAGASIALFALGTPGFTSPLSVNALLNAVSFIGCVAVGMTFITLTGNIMSLCLGATVSASALTFLASLSFGIPAAFLTAIAFGVAITAAQGLLVGYIRANPILVSSWSLSPDRRHRARDRRPAYLSRRQRLADVQGARRRHPGRGTLFLRNRDRRPVHPVVDADR